MQFRYYNNYNNIKIFITTTVFPKVKKPPSELTTLASYDVRTFTCCNVLAFNAKQNLNLMKCFRLFVKVE